MNARQEKPDPLPRATRLSTAATLAGVARVSCRAGRGPRLPAPRTPRARLCYVAEVLAFDDGVHILGTTLHLDARRGRARGVVSHAHSDHVAQHECWVASPATARLCARRWGAAQVESHDFGVPWQEGEAQVTLLPAGHILGSAMVLVEHRGLRILYTGDFRTGPSLTAEPCRVVPADVLVMECTFGEPLYRFPPREQVAGQVVEFIEECFSAREVPLLLAYTLGKAQEVAKLLGDRGYHVALSAEAYQMLEVYRELGVEFRGCAPMDGRSLEKTVVVLPPQWGRHSLATRLPRHRTAFLSGWAMGQQPDRVGPAPDESFAFSDHADFDELLAFAEAVAPRQIYTLHGPDGFCEHLRARGHHAEPARSGAQLQLL